MDGGFSSGAHSRDDQCIDCAAKGYVFFPRINVVSATGNMSLHRVSEDNMVDRWFFIAEGVPVLFMQIYRRSREALCNGPGACVPLYNCTPVQGLLAICFFMSSAARVKKLSLSGLLLYWLCIADQVFVQWLQLQKKHPQARYVGCLVRLICSTTGTDYAFVLLESLVCFGIGGGKTNTYFTNCLEMYLYQLQWKFLCQTRMILT
uniref:UDP-N-acetylglucosamine transferase subunit ALG14 n=1 Tax=Salix viminalis TaxID=40686 RepID=A0A6N2N5N2_SALVM